MGKPDKKLKKILFIMGITGAVYGSFRYLLPLVVPFLLAWGLAALLRPSARWISAKCRVTVRGKTWAVPVGLAGVVELVIILALLGIGLYAGGRKLLFEAGLLMEQIPVWTEALDRWLTGICRRMEECLCLKDGLLVVLMREMLKGLIVSMKDAAMPYLMVNSVSVFRWGIGISVVLVIVLAATGMALQEMDVWKKRCRRSIYREEFALIGRRLAIMANAYGKTQLIIMTLTSLICMLGFWLMKNPYYILLGIGIGLLDALPIFGTGTVLIPWAVVRMVQGQWKMAVALTLLYLICYFLREILEAKLMGEQVGLSPLETLISMYVGLQLFGIAGFLLGPIGLLLIRDLVEAME